MKMHVTKQNPQKPPSSKGVAITTENIKFALSIPG